MKRLLIFLMLVFAPVVVFSQVFTNLTVTKRLSVGDSVVTAYVTADSTMVGTFKLKEIVSFPANPGLGTQVVVGGEYYTWNGTDWVGYSDVLTINDTLNILVTHNYLFESIQDLNTPKSFPGNDTVTLGYFHNSYDTLQLTRDLTLFIDTTGMYKEREGSFSLDALGVGQYHSFAISSNAEILNIEYKADSIWRGNLFGNDIFGRFKKTAAYTRINVVCDTFSYPDVDVTSPVAFTFTVDNDNPDSLYMSYSEAVNITTAGFLLDSAGGSPVISITSVGNSGTANPYFLLGDSLKEGGVYFMDYNAGTGSTADLKGNPLLSFTDSSVTNNVGGGLQSLTINLNNGDLITKNGDDYTSGTGAGGWTGYVLFDQYVASGTDGFIQFIVQEDGASYVAGFDAAFTNKGYTQYDRGAYYSSGQIYDITNGSLGSVRATVTTGDYVRIDRTSGTITIQTSSDGQNFTPVHTFSSTTADMYINLNISSGSMTVHSLQGSNLTQ